MGIRCPCCASRTTHNEGCSQGRKIGLVFEATVIQKVLLKIDYIQSQIRNTAGAPIAWFCNSIPWGKTLLSTNQQGLGFGI
jgi:hypothetical protein